MLRCRQHCLGSLCLAVFIYCQAEVDLQFSLYQILSQHPLYDPDARGRDLDEAYEKKTSTFGYD